MGRSWWLHGVATYTARRLPAPASPPLPVHHVSAELGTVAQTNSQTGPHNLKPVVSCPDFIESTELFTSLFETEYAPPVHGCLDLSVYCQGYAVSEEEVTQVRRSVLLCSIVRVEY